MTFPEALAHLLDYRVMQRVDGDQCYNFWFNKDTGSGMYEEDAYKFASMWFVSIDDFTADNWEFADEASETRIKEKYGDSHRYVKGIGLARR